MRDGLYKIDFHTVHGTGSGVVYAIAGKIRGGNSGFAFIGNYNGQGNEVTARVSTRRHNFDPSFKPLFGIEGVTLMLKGIMSGDMIDLEGTALQVPGVNFKAVLTWLAD